MFDKKFETIHVDDLDEIINDIELIDIRETYEYRAGHIKELRTFQYQSF